MNYYLIEWYQSGPGSYEDSALIEDDNGVLLFKTEDAAKVWTDAHPLTDEDLTFKPTSGHAQQWYDVKACHVEGDAE